MPAYKDETTNANAAREKNIAGAIKLQRASKAFALFSRLSHAAGRGGRKEMLIPTAVGPVPALTYGFGGERRPLYVDMHGGGFVLGNAFMDEAMNLEVAKRVGCAIISLDYAKAPRHPFPVALIQVLQSVDYLRSRSGEFGIDPERIGIGGHSAGGNLAAAACLKAKREGLPAFSCQLLDYPPLDLATDPFAKPRPAGCIPPSMAAMFNDCYVERETARDPLASPLFADEAELSGLPPALVILAGMDSLHDEGLRYAEKLEAAGVPVELREYPEAKHGFTTGKGRDRDDAVEKIIRFLSVHFLG
jgi:acetyl esterase